MIPEWEEEVVIFTPKCTFAERVESDGLYYGRLLLSPLKGGQGETLGIAMRRALLREVEGTCITRVKFRNVPEGSATIEGVEESIYEILKNLKEIVLRSNLYGVRDASICVKGPRCITAQDIILPPSVQVVDGTQYIASVIKPIDLVMELKINRDRGYNSEPRRDFSEDESYPLCPDKSYTLYPYYSPIKNANYSRLTFQKRDEIEEVLIIEVWTNGSCTPKEAFLQASHSLIGLLLPFLQAQEEGPNLKKKQNQSRFSLPLFLVFEKKLGSIKTKALIDELELPRKTYNCLKRANIKTVLDLLNKSQEDLISIPNLRVEDLRRILDAVYKFLHS